ncbi:competence protein, ComEA family [Campylobacter sp. CCUG 57310]|nr:competence protein, ComEA family [Campylobacter sp. CCUG 57310]QKF91861.1 competence protein, ComEA family [Campylobacter sp. CCUG 57310]QKF92334.1 competence protein, ComEA family [Campylobacter sp. CCUG 57310]
MNTVKNILLALIMLWLSAFAQINLNTATKEELMSLKGIGESKAEAIMEYRKMNKFNSIDDIKNVNGIGDKTFEALKQDISVSGKSVMPANTTKKIKDKVSKTKDTKEKTTKQADKVKDTKDSLSKKVKDKEDNLKKEAKKAKSKEDKTDKAKDAKEKIQDAKESMKKDTKKTKESKDGKIKKEKKG